MFQKNLHWWIKLAAGRACMYSSLFRALYFQLDFFRNGSE